MNRWLDIARRWWPALLVTVFGTVMLWPIPAGRMPLSADHTVHLTRAFLYADVLARFDLRGWTPVWFFGTPIGELYPVLGDVLVAGVRLLGLGLLDWSQAYALGFTVVFLTQGWVMLRAGRLLGWGPLPGLVAALLVMADVGSYREGGWVYVVFYGVWPQTLATSLTWLGFAELARATQLAEEAPERLGRALARAGLALGASLLAHPMSITTIAVGGPIAVLALGGLDASRIRRAAATGLVAAALAVGLAAWWLLPMISNRGWMASYGWLWLDLSTMIEHAADGHWCQSMPASVGHAISLGFVLVAVMGKRPARFFAATGLVLWLLASRDVMWTLRLDLVSEGFTHLQWQRFITAAKPGLFLMAGAAVGALAHLAAWSWQALIPPLRVVVSGLAGLAAAAGGVTMAHDLHDGFAELDPMIGEVQRVRIPGPGSEGLDADHAALASWLGEQWNTRDRFWRTTVRDHRNIHWFMDLPVEADGVPVLKQGFTPGDNFVHKPEKAPAPLQELAQVRYEIRRGQRPPRDAVASFGSVHVSERANWRTSEGLRLEGPGQVAVLERDFERGVVRVSVQGTTGPTRLVFGIAGFGRWDLVGPDGESIDWVEVPIVGDGPVATPAQRRGGELRGGKAHGDDGTEPTLIAAEVHDGEYTLHYRSWRVRDLLGLGITALAFGVCTSLLGWPRRVAVPPARLIAMHRRLGKLGHPIVLACLVVAALVLGGVRWARGRAREASEATGFILDGRAEVGLHARAGYLKTDMLIRPAIVFDRRHREPAVVTFDDVRLDETLHGWVALDDDDAKLKKQGTQRLVIEARGSDDEPWHPLYDRVLVHRPGQIPLALSTGPLGGRRADLRVRAEASGSRPPEIGLQLQLSGEEP